MSNPEHIEGFRTLTHVTTRRQIKGKFTDRLEAAKLLVSVFEKKVNVSASNSLERVVVFQEFSENEQNLLRIFFRREGLQATFLPINMDLFLEHVETTAEECLTLVCGEYPLGDEPALLEKQSSILTLYPELVEKFVDLVEQRLRRPDIGASIVVEERLGRFRALEMGQRQLRRWYKHVKQTKKNFIENVSAISIVPGWGVAGFVRKSEPAQSYSHYFNDMDEADSVFTLVEKIIGQIKEQLVLYSLSFEELSSVTVACPYWIFSAFLLDALKSEFAMDDAKQLSLQDALYGWQPLISFVSLFERRAASALFISVDTYMRSNVIMVTDR